MNLEPPLAILLAEDNATNQLVFTKLMQRYSVDITVAANGRIALEHASAPRLRRRVHGHAHARNGRARGNPRDPRARRAQGRVPIIALTANAFADDIKACRDAGMDEFIAKPVRKKILMEKLAGLLGRRSAIPGCRATETATAPRRPTALPVTPPAEVALADVAPVLDRAALDTFIEEIELDGVRATLDVYLEETVERLALMRRLSCESRSCEDRDRGAHAEGLVVNLRADPALHIGADAGICRAPDRAGRLSRSARPHRCGVCGVA